LVGDSGDASPIRVSIGLESKPDEARAVSVVFLSAGIEARVERDIARSSLDVPWELRLSVCPVSFARRFSGTLEPQLAKDVWPGLMRFVYRIARCFHGRRGGVVVVTDPESQIEIALSDDLPGEAYKQLIRLNLDEILATRIGWSEPAECWCDLMGNPIGQRP
jgi:hypothetical protein